MGNEKTGLSSKPVSLVGLDSLVFDVDVVPLFNLELRMLANYLPEDKRAIIIDYLRKNPGRGEGILRNGATPDTYLLEFSSSLLVVEFNLLKDAFKPVFDENKDHLQKEAYDILYNPEKTRGYATVREITRDLDGFPITENLDFFLTQNARAIPQTFQRYKILLDADVLKKLD